MDFDGHKLSLLLVQSRNQRNMYEHFDRLLLVLEVEFTLWPTNLILNCGRTRKYFNSLSFSFSVCGCARARVYIYIYVCVCVCVVCVCVCVCVWCVCV